MNPLPQSLVTEKVAIPWGKVTTDVLPAVGEGVGVGVAIGTGVGVGVATGLGVGVETGTGVGVATGVGDGVTAPPPVLLPIKGARLDWR